MEIKITYGIGEGPTELAAFDRALYDAGIANYNLIKLSSIIPPDSNVKVGKIDWNNKAHGDKLYVVLSECTETRKGKKAWAGLGWIIAEDDSCKGIFVEQTGSSEKEVKKMITDSLESIQKYRKNKYKPIRYKICGIKCKGVPACSLVCAVYKSEGWD